MCDGLVGIDDEQHVAEPREDEFGCMPCLQGMDELLLVRAAREVIHDPKLTSAVRRLVLA